MPEPSSGEISVEDARARMLAGVVPGAAETTPLLAAFGRTLAEPIVAIRDQPPFDASAMDGYAILAGAAFTSRFKVIGESAAGRPFAGEIVANEAVRIFTGAGVPDGCRVVVQERAIRDGDRVTFEMHTPISSNIRARGGDFRVGQVLLRAGARTGRLEPCSGRRRRAGDGSAGAPSPRGHPLHGEEIVKAGAAATDAPDLRFQWPGAGGADHGVGRDGRSAGARQRMTKPPSPPRWLTWPAT